MFLNNLLFGKLLKSCFIIDHFYPHDIKMFSCDICNTNFTRGSSLNMHNESVHQGIKHKCHICGLSLVNLRLHIDSKHKQ